nr:hypothetical protein BCU47_16205 [Enterovibrio norvegicus]
MFKRQSFTTFPQLKTINAPNIDRDNTTQRHNDHNNKTPFIIMQVNHLSLNEHNTSQMKNAIGEITFIPMHIKMALSGD